MLFAICTKLYVYYSEWFYFELFISLTHRVSILNWVMCFVMYDSLFAQHAKVEYFFQFEMESTNDVNQKKNTY